MADYTFAGNTVLVEGTGEFAVGATGVLRTSSDGPPLPIYDLNDSPISEIIVGPRGVHQAFKADEPDGLLDFGSAMIPVVSQESHRAGMRAIEVAEGAAVQAGEAMGQASDAAAAARLAAGVVVATPRFVLHGGDADAPRPDEDVLPVIWIGSVEPSHADTGRDHWITPSSWGSGTP